MARTKRTETIAGKDTFHVLGLADQVVKGAASHALNVAQRRAEMAAEPVTLTIERRALFGPAEQLFRVVRDVDGIVLTFTLL